MKRLDNGEGNSPMLSVRLSLKTMELLDALIANLPPHPIAGPPPRLMVVRAVIDAGIEAIAAREGIKVGTTPTKPSSSNGKARKARPAKKDPKAVHPHSRARAEKRAAARLAAGCTCASAHVPGCKLYRQPSVA